MSNQIDKALKDSIISDEAINIAKDFSEIALDSIFKEGLLKEIPIIGTLVSLGKMAYSIKDRQTLKKIAIFLSQLGDVSLEDRKKFAMKLDEEDEFKETVAEKVLLLLERLDETAKAAIISNLFKLYVLELLDKDKFMRFSNIVEKAFFNDLIVLSKTSSFSPNYKDHQLFPSMDSFTGLSSLGVYTSKFGGEGKPGLAYVKSKVGTTLSDIMFYDLNNLDFLDYIKSIKN